MALRIDNGLSYLANGTGVTNTLVVLNTFIVVPDLDDLVFSTGDVVLTFVKDGESVDLSSRRSVEHADGLSIEAIPVGDLAVRTSSKDLRLIGVIEDGLEHGGLEQAHDTSVRLDVPNNARAIVRGGYGVGIRLVDLNIRDSTSVFLEGSFHNLSLSSDSPDSNFTLQTTGHDLLAIVSASDSSDTVVVSIVDGIHELARLGQEASYLAIVPPGQD